MFENEKDWEDRLKSILELDYGHQVFSQMHYTKNGRDKYLDLYVMTNPDWIHHDLFPIVGIECKILGTPTRKMGWLISSRDQMAEYADPKNRYRRDGQFYPPLNICLLATPESWHEGVVYKWKGRQAKGPCCWETMTFIFQRILLQVRCSILLDKRFQTNSEGGSVTNYYLGE